MYLFNFLTAGSVSLVLLLHTCIVSVDVILYNWCPFPVYAWSIIGPAVSERFTVSKLSEKRFPTSTQPSVNIKMTIDPDLGKVGTGQLQFEYTVDNKATSRTFWDLSMIDGYIVQQPPPTVRPSPIPNKPGNIFHGYHVTITPRGNVEAGNPLSKCRQVSTPDNKGFNDKPDNVYWTPYDDQTSMHDCPVGFGEFLIDLCGFVRPFSGLKDER